jgi:hypothetical protein
MPETHVALLYTALPYAGWASGCTSGCASLNAGNSDNAALMREMVGYSDMSTWNLQHARNVKREDSHEYHTRRGTPTNLQAGDRGCTTGVVPAWIAGRHVDARARVCVPMRHEERRGDW